MLCCIAYIRTYIHLHFLYRGENHSIVEVNRYSLHSILQQSPRIVLCLRVGYINNSILHYSDVIMGEMASQITSHPIVYLSVYSGADERKNKSSASLAFVRWIHRWPVNSPHKGPVTRKMFPFDDVIISLHPQIPMRPFIYIAQFCWHGLALSRAWKSNYPHYNVWYEITYPCISFNGATVEV